MDLHPAQHHDDNGHDQSQEATGVDDDVGVSGLHSVHRVCCFLLCRVAGEWGQVFLNMLFTTPSKTAGTNAQSLNLSQNPATS